MMLTRGRAVLLLGTPCLVMLTCFGIPLGLMALSSLHSDDAGWTLANYGRIVGSAYFWGVLVSTLRLAAIVTASTLILGYALAYYIVFHLHNRDRPPGGPCNSYYTAVYQRHRIVVRLDPDAWTCRCDQSLAA